MASNSQRKHTIALQQELIAKSAARLFAKKGFDRTTVDEIATACGMSKGNIYNYVKSKKQILILVVDNAVKPMYELLAKLDAAQESDSATETLSQSIRFLYEWADAAQDQIRFIHSRVHSLDRETRKRLSDAEESLIKAFEALLARGCAIGEFEIEDLRTVAHEIFILAHIWADRQHFFRSHDSLEDHVRKRIDFVLKAIRSDRYQ